MQSNKYQLFVILSLVVALFLSSCARPPLEKIAQGENPLFYDDLPMESLLTAAVRHLHYLETLPGDSSFLLGDERYPISWLRESINSFIDILKQEPGPRELARIVAENFTVYQASGREKQPEGEMLITGYYEPFLRGSLTRKAPFLYPLYAPPADLIRLKESKSGKTIFKRLDKNNTVRPYWTRKEIEENGYAAGNELVYLNDPVDVFILHVQGSGKIQLTDGSVRSIHYAASNGLEYFSIGKLLVDQGKLSLEEASLPAIRTYLRNHPDEQNAILHHNKKFIFFSWVPTNSPVGSIGEPLVAGRSIAIDSTVLPHQAFGFLKSRKPVVDADGKITKWATLHRFVFPQDSGAAITGAGRADLFWGSGKYAKIAAGNMKEVGELYFLVKNRFEEQEQ